MVTSAALTVELKTLAWSVILVFAQIAIQAGFATSETGVAYNASARDDAAAPKSPVSGRARRALNNLLETYPVFLALALALAATGRSGGTGADGAVLWLVARVAYVPVYLAGVPYLRTAIWIASIVGLLMMIARLVA